MLNIHTSGVAIPHRRRVVCSNEELGSCVNRRNPWLLFQKLLTQLGNYREVGINDVRDLVFHDMSQQQGGTALVKAVIRQ